MRNAELYERYKNYNLDEDPSGAYGISILSEVVKRAGGLEKVGQWLVVERCRKLEREALADSLTHQ